MFFINLIYYLTTLNIKSFLFYINLILYAARIAIQNNEIARIKKEERDKKRFLLEIKAMQKALQTIKSNISFILGELDTNAKAFNLYKNFFYIYPLIFIPHLIIFGVYTLEGEAILIWFADIKRQIIRLPSSQWFGYWVSGLIGVLVAVSYILCIDMTERDLQRLLAFFAKFSSKVYSGFLFNLNKLAIYIKGTRKITLPLMGYILVFGLLFDIIPSTLDQWYAVIRAVFRRHPIFLLLVGIMLCFAYFYFVVTIIILIVNSAVSNFIL